MVDAILSDPLYLLLNDGFLFKGRVEEQLGVLDVEVRAVDGQLWGGLHVDLPAR